MLCKLPISRYQFPIDHNFYPFFTISIRDNINFLAGLTGRRKVIAIFIETSAMAIQFSLVSLVLAITKIEFYVLPDNCDYLIDGFNRPGWQAPPNSHK